MENAGKKNINDQEYPILKEDKRYLFLHEVPERKKVEKEEGEHVEWTICPFLDLDRCGIPSPRDA